MLSVVIPTLNAQAQLPVLLSQLSTYVDEIIVSDGGSSDQTQSCALTGSAARLAVGASGRGPQIRRAIVWSRAQNASDWLLILHADSRLPEGWYEAVSGHMTAHPARAGYFKFALDDRGFWPFIAEKLVSLRCFALALPYGDQGLLIRRDLYERVGGYPDWPLFEDVSLIKALGRRRLRRLPATLMTCAQKYKRDGYWARCTHNLKLICKYLMGASPQSLAEHYK